VIRLAARLATAALLAFAVRAAAAQSIPNTGPRSDPYAPQNAISPAPAVNQALRYPLPTTSATPTAQTQAMPDPPLPPIVTPADRNTQLASPLTSSQATSSQATYSQATYSQATYSQAVLFAPGQIVGRVGDKTILYCDVAPIVNLRMAPVLAKAKSPAERQAMEAAYRDPLTKNVIDQLVFNKMLLMEFERGMPSELRTDAKKRAESEGKLKKTIRNAFESSLTAAREKVSKASQEDIENLMRQDATIVRLALLMKERQLESPGELDVVLHEYGTSLELQIRDYGEYMMGMEAARTQLGIGNSSGPKAKPKKEITHQEMLDYYQAHVADYYIPAKVRFEILTAKFSKFSGDRNAAYDAIVRMGNEIVLGGTPFPAVARKHSHEPHAQDGGYYDWVSPGSLASKPIDQAIFSVEVDKLSQIIEDETGFHILHVLERKDPGQISFLEAQEGIREAIDNQRRSAEREKYFATIRARTKVWTIFDPPIETAAQPTETEKR
jgi:hypothetical protein